MIILAIAMFRFLDVRQILNVLVDRVYAYITDNGIFDFIYFVPFQMQIKN